MTFEEFIATHIHITDAVEIAAMFEKTGYADAVNPHTTSIHVYDEECYIIEELADGECYLILGNQGYGSKERVFLEQTLYNWAQGE